MSRLGAFLRRCPSEAGYTLIELLAVLTILMTVVTGLTMVFVSGSKAELDMNQRFQAQQNARLALDKVRREAHCASAITPTGPASSITMTLPTACAGGGSIDWCAVGSGSRYALHRSASAPCDAADPKFADYLTTASIFDYAAQTSTSLAKLEVTLPVDLDPVDSARAYTLEDAIALRNSTRS